MLCPKCTYKRTAADTAPEWQCPACGVAYSKVMKATVPAPVAPAITSMVEPSRGSNLWRIAIILVAIVVAGWWWSAHRGAGKNSAAEDMENARQDYLAERYDHALRKYSAIAAKGNHVAQYYLGSIDQYGMIKDVGFGNAVAYVRTPNIDKAKGWYEKSAAQGDPRAQYALAYLYMNHGREMGELTEEERIAKAVDLFNAAAAKGEPHAQFALGRMYYEGMLQSPENSTAEQWLTKAAVQGNAPALYALSGLYLHGRGGKAKNAVYAYVLMKISFGQYVKNMSDSNWVSDGLNPFWASANFETVAKTLSPTELNRAEAVIAEWKPGTDLPREVFPD